MAVVPTDLFAQAGYRVRADWGAQGLANLAGCAVLVVVDVLSFCTAVDVAVSRGASVRPVRWEDQPVPEPGLLIGGERGRGLSLSPVSLLDLPAGARLALRSPNGATLSATASDTGAIVLAGCLRNASAVAAEASALADVGSIGVMAAGERWPEGALRPAVEDLIGAGGVISALLSAGSRPASPEALAAADSFEGAHRRGLQATLASCGSGGQLIAAGYERDVELAAQHDVSTTVAILREGAYQA